MDQFSERKELAYRCLIDAARSLSSAADIKGLIDKILDSSRAVMHCLACSVSLPDPGTGDLLIRGTQARLKNLVLRVPSGKGIAGRVYRTRVPENTANAQTDSDHYAGIGTETKTPALAMLTIPLLDGEMCHGVMQALNPIDRNQFDSFDEEVFLAFGSLIAATLTRMQVWEQAKQKEIEDAYRHAELSIARQAQVSFMPSRRFEWGALKIRVFQEQAADVGGDFYAYREIGEQCLLVAVGDASGKGIPAALESARVCTLISLTAPSCSPERLPQWLAELNNSIQATAEEAGSLTTLAVLLIDSKRRMVSACSFGQYRPRFLSHANRWEELVCAIYPPLGVETAIEFPVLTIPLAVGRKWILLTDGFVEARNTEGEQFGNSALAGALAGSVAGQLEPLAALEAGWREFSKNGPDRDDATALLVVDSFPQPDSSLECEVSPDTIPDLRAFCKAWAEYAGVEETNTYNAILACDEIFTNVYRHAYSGHPGRIRCEAMIDPTSITYLIRHWGIGLTSQADNPPGSEETRIGGYGLPFVRRVFDRVEFDTRPERSNILLSKRIVPAPANGER
jgi:sigma-B regulation protein RsbU (phosphoserine phosphatase)